MVYNNYESECGSVVSHAFRYAMLLDMPMSSRVRARLGSHGRRSLLRVLYTWYSGLLYLRS